MKKRIPFPFLGFPGDYLMFDFAALLDFETARGESVLNVMISQAFDVRFVAAALPAGLKRCWQATGRYNPATYPAEVLQLLDEKATTQAVYLQISSALVEALLASGIMTPADGSEEAAADGTEKKQTPSTASAPSLRRRS